MKRTAVGLWMLLCPFLAGQQVARLVEGAREAGSYTLRWDGRDGRGKELASGIYLYRLRAGERMETRKLVLVR